MRDYIAERLEMKNQLSKIEETLKDPEEVRKSDRDQAVHLYFRRYDESPVTEKFLLVVSKIETENPFIITSFFIDEIRAGKEPPIYEKSQIPHLSTWGLEKAPQKR